jgi:hypothetical protein
MSFVEACKLYRISLFKRLQPHATSSACDVSLVLLSTLFSLFTDQCSSQRIKDQFSQLFALNTIGYIHQQIHTK